MVELFEEIVHEITGEPLKFLLEIIQFCLLVLIIKAIGFGFGEKKGMITNMLAERREKIVGQLQAVEEAEKELVLAEEKARFILNEAKTEAEQTIRAAKQAAEEEEAAHLAAIDEEAATIEKQAEESLEKERAEAMSGVHDQLVDLVTLGTRQVLDEGFSPSEQRALVQKAILSSLDDLEGISLS